MTGSGSVRSRLEESRVLNWQKDVARSTTGRAPKEQRNTTQMIVNHITTPNVVIANSTPYPKQDKDISTRAIIGTLIGVGAGAAVAYGMSNDQHENRQSQSYASYPSKGHETAIIIRSPLVDVKNYQPQHTSIAGSNRSRSRYGIDGPRVETVVSSKHSSRRSASDHYSSLPPVTESHTGQTVVRTANGTRVLTGSMRSRSSHTSSSRRRESEYAPSAAYVPLPKSRTSTLITKHDTVVPEDSISQVSTVRPQHRESSSHYEGSRSGSSYKHSSRNRNNRYAR